MWFKIKRVIAALILVLLTDADLTVPDQWVQAYQQYQTASVQAIKQAS